MDGPIRPDLALDDAADPHVAAAADLKHGQRYVPPRNRALGIAAALRDLGEFARVGVSAGAELPDQIIGDKLDVGSLIQCACLSVDGPA